MINDGEQGRVDYTVYLKDRLTGFDGQSTPPLGTGDEEFPELAAILRQFASPFQHRPACTGPVAWKDWPAVEADIRTFDDRHGGRGRRRAVHDVAVAGTDRPVPAQSVLPETTRRICSRSPT